MKNNIEIAVKKVRGNAKIPVYSSLCAAGADLFAVLDEPMQIAPNETKFIPSGCAFQIPDGLVGLVYARSGLSCKQGLAPANKVGVIDSDYRGEVMVALHNHDAETRTINNGDKIAQIVFTPYFQADFTETTELDSTVRGDGRFGSTGK